MKREGSRTGGRIGRYCETSTALALHSDRRLAHLLAQTRVLGSGIGGSTSLVDVDGVPVFAKRVALTDLELRPENVRSTANLFGLPPFFQYGVGSPGFGAWRELAGNIIATNWVLADRSAAFPLLYHWRVLPGAAPERGDIERAVEHWGGSAAVRHRLHALAESSAGVVLFLEYVPRTLRGWLADQVAAGPEATASACGMLETRLLADTAFMNGHGLWHFDAHFDNIVTDGRRLYFTDLGLATSTRFDLSHAETAFLDRNRTHDLAYTAMGLVNWLVTEACGVRERNAYVRACAAGREPAGAPSAIADVIRRYAPVATVMNDFYRDLFGVSRSTPFPRGAVERAWATARPDLRPTV